MAYLMSLFVLFAVPAWSLAAGTYRAETFTPALPASLGPVQQRFAAALAQNQAWLQGYLTKLNLPPGTSLPYDEHMGVTRAEYHALSEAYEHPIIKSLRATQLEVSGVRGVVFQAKAPNDFLNDVVIDETGALHARGGLICQPEIVKGRKAVFGVWSGTTWFHESADRERGAHRLFELSIGRLDSSGRLFLSFQDSRTEAKKRIYENTLMTWLEKLPANK